MATEFVSFDQSVIIDFSALKKLEESLLNEHFELNYCIKYKDSSTVEDIDLIELGCERNYLDKKIDRLIIRGKEKLTLSESKPESLEVLKPSFTSEEDLTWEQLKYFIGKEFSTKVYKSLSNQEYENSKERLYFNLYATYYLLCIAIFWVLRGLFKVTSKKFDLDARIELAEYSKLPVCSTIEITILTNVKKSVQAKISSTNKQTCIRIKKIIENHVRDWKSPHSFLYTHPVVKLFGNPTAIAFYIALLILLALITQKLLLFFLSIKFDFRLLDFVNSLGFLEQVLCLIALWAAVEQVQKSIGFFITLLRDNFYGHCILAIGEEEIKLSQVNTFHKKAGNLINAIVATLVVGILTSLLWPPLSKLFSIIWKSLN